MTETPQPDIRRDPDSAEAVESPPYIGMSAAAAEEQDDVRKMRREEPASVTSLFRRLIEDVATLFRKELAMATSEILHSVDDARGALASMLSGAAVLYAGFIFLLLSATLGLALVLEPWLAALIVGGGVALIGLIMVQSSKSKLKPSHFSMQHTADSLRKDREMIGRQGQ